MSPTLTAELIDISEKNVMQRWRISLMPMGYIYLGLDLKMMKGKSWTIPFLQIPSCPYCNKLTPHVVVDFFVNYYGEPHL